VAPPLALIVILNVSMTAVKTCLGNLLPKFRHVVWLPVTLLIDGALHDHQLADVHGSVGRVTSGHEGPRGRPSSQ
jgi:hypothetical protein